MTPLPRRMRLVTAGGQRRCRRSTEPILAGVMLRRPEVVESEIFGCAHAAELLPDYLMLALVCRRMFKEMQHPKLHMRFLL